MEVSRAVGTSEGRPTQDPSSERSLVHDSLGSKETVPAATQPAPFPEYPPPQSLYPESQQSLRSGVYHTQDSASFPFRLSFCFHHHCRLSAPSSTSGVCCPTFSVLRLLCVASSSSFSLRFITTLFMSLCLGLAIRLPQGASWVGPLVTLHYAVSQLNKVLMLGHFIRC